MPKKIVAAPAADGTPAVEEAPGKTVAAKVSFETFDRLNVLCFALSRQTKTKVSMRDLVEKAINEYVDRNKVDLADAMK